MDHDQELEHLRARVAELETLVGRLTTAPSARSHPPASTEDGLSRRHMLRKGLGLSAVAVAGIGALDALGSPAAADDRDGVLVAQTVSPTAASSAPTRITNPSATDLSTVLFQVDNTTGQALDLPGTAAAIAATINTSEHVTVDHSAILGVAADGNGVRGQSNAGAGVYGWSDGGPGVYGTGFPGIHGWGGIGTAVKAEATDGLGVDVTSDWMGIRVVAGVTGISAHSQQGYAIQGSTDSASLAGVYGLSADGVGVVGYSQSNTATVGVSVDGAGVQAESTSSDGLQAVSQSGLAVRATSTSGAAVEASSAGTSTTVTAANTGTGAGLVVTSERNLGASFEGGQAAIRLVPHATKGHPTFGEHQRGELAVDSVGSLWLCTKPGSPGTWKALAFA